MSKQRSSDLPDQDADSIKDLIQEFRDRLHAPSKYVMGSRPSATHDDVHGHYGPVELENVQLRRLLAKAIPILEKHPNAKKAQLLQIPADVLEDVLCCCDALTQVHVQMSGPFLRDFIEGRWRRDHVPKALLRIESASIGVRFRHSYEDWLKHDLQYGVDDDWEYVARAQLAGSSVPFIYTSESFSVVASQLAARIQSAYIGSFTASRECLVWDKANLPEFLANTNTATNTIVGKLQLRSAQYDENVDYEIRLGRYTQLVLATFKEVRKITIDEFVGAKTHYKQEPDENEEFSAFFLERCLDHGIADVSIHKLGRTMDALQVAHFCLADSLKLGAKQRSLSVVAWLDAQASFGKIVELICKEVATGRVKHGFVLYFEGSFNPTIVMAQARLNWVEERNEYEKVFDDESTLRVKSRKVRIDQQVLVTFQPK